MRINKGKGILSWGGGTNTAVRMQWFKKNYNVIAIVKKDVNFLAEVYGIKSILKEEIKNLEYDYVLISAIEEYVKPILSEIEELGINEDKILTLSDLEEENGVNIYTDEMVSRQLEVIKEILTASDDEIADFYWMRERILRYGIFPFGYGWCNDEKTNYNLYGLQQIPAEFTDFCISISNLKVKTAMEIGVYRGRSSYFISAILSRKNPDLVYSMVDIEDRLDNFEKFNELLLCLKKCIPSSSKDYIGKEYDFVFIDADHSYDNSIADYNNVGQYSKVMTAFHDIYAREYDHENGGIVRMLLEVMERTQGQYHRIFSVYPDKWMGIGAVYKV